MVCMFFFSSRRRHTRCSRDWSSDVCSSDLPGFSRAAATAIRAGSPQAGHEILDQLDRLGAAVLLPEDAAFPPLLSEVPDPPALLFAWGDTALLARPSAGIVGSRDPSPHAAPAARLLAARVAGGGGVAGCRVARRIGAV